MSNRHEYRPGRTILSFLRIVAAMVAAALAWDNQVKIIDLLNRIVDKPPIVIHLKQAAADRGPRSGVKRGGGCGEFRYWDASAGACRDARGKP